VESVDRVGDVMFIKYLSYVGYVSLRRFHSLNNTWSWLFHLGHVRFSAQHNYVYLRILGFEFDGLVPID